MDDLIDNSVLNPRCRADLRRLLGMFKANSAKVSHGPTPYDHTTLPPCVDQITSSKAGITKPPLFRPTTAGGLKVPEEWTRDPDTTKQERRLLASVDERLKRAASAPKKGRSGAPLTAKEQEFIYRYAEYKHGSKVLRGEKTHDRTLAYRAYTDAFLSFMGRPPSTTELQEADRLTFVLPNPSSSSCRVGVVSKPHAPTPHKHISNSNESVTCCMQQVFPPERRVERAARPGSTLVDRTTFSSQCVSANVSPARSSAARGGSSGRAHEGSGSGAVVAPPPIHQPPFDAKRRCSRCNARLPPRLVKNVCPSCDK